MNTLQDILIQAKQNMSLCKMCKECNGEVCKGMVPGPGGKGSGSTFTRNVKQLKAVSLNMKVIHSDQNVSTDFDFFGHRLSAPIMAAPIANVQTNYGSTVDERSYLEALLSGINQANLCAFLGDGPQKMAFDLPLEILEHHQGRGVMTIKPWKLDTFFEKISRSLAKNPMAIASDLDAAGLSALKNIETPVEFKTVDDLKKIKAMLKNTPFIIKGIMSVEDAEKALQAQADGIIISNHGGRVMDSGLSSIEVLEEIAQFVNHRCMILIDGGFRSGTDVFKALALGADAVLIGRPYSHAAIGGLDLGVKLLSEKLISELKDAMYMTNCSNLDDIRRDCVNCQF
jgi:4-hydroxymandelate oxidase